MVLYVGWPAAVVGDDGVEEEDPDQEDWTGGAEDRNMFY